MPSNGEHRRLTVPAERQEPIYSAIASELIALTPETWRTATMRVSVNESPKGVLGMAHVISGPDGHKEIVIASETMFELTYSLLRLFEEFSQPWKVVTFNIKIRPEGGWQYAADYEYR
jgi:hypothetical protein